MITSLLNMVFNRFGWYFGSYDESADRNNADFWRCEHGPDCQACLTVSVAEAIWHEDQTEIAAEGSKRVA